MYSRCTSGQPLPVRLSFSRLSLPIPRLLFAGFLILGMVLRVTTGRAHAQNAPPGGPNLNTERLTQDLVTVNVRYHGAGPLPPPTGLVYPLVDSDGDGTNDTVAVKWDDIEGATKYSVKVSAGYDTDGDGAVDATADIDFSTI